MKNVQVLVLAGGVGKRFWPLKNSKYLFKFAGQTLLEHNLQKLKDSGFKDVIVVSNQETDQLIKGIDIKGLNIKTKVQEAARGMADAVLAAREAITGDPLLIMNATDLVADELYSTIFSKLNQGQNILVGKKISNYFPGGYLKLSGSKVVGIIEKPKPGEEPSDLLSLVFHGFQTPLDFIQILEKTTSNQDDIYEQALSKYLDTANFDLISYSDYWQATKYPWDLLAVTKLLSKNFKSYISNEAQVSPHANIDGNVILEAGVKVFANASIKGPAYIGKNTIIGNGALVRDSNIGENCVIGYNTEIARSWIDDDCWFHSNYIGDSVLGKNVSLGAGAILANLRLDEQEISSQVNGSKVNSNTNKLGSIIGDNVRIGVNSSLMPGVKIGSNSFISSGLVVGEDIAENIYCSGEVKLKQIKNNFKSVKDSRSSFRKKLNA